MKKFCFLLLTLLLGSYFLFPAQTRALSWLDLFPPAKPAQKSQKAASDKNASPNSGDPKTFPNNLKGSTVECQGGVNLSNTWNNDEPEPTPMPNGQVGSGNYIDARDLQKNVELGKEQSNLGPRFFISDTLRGEIKFDEDSADTARTSYLPDGYGNILKYGSYKNLERFKSEYLVDMAKSLSKQPEYDSASCDYTLYYDCNGTPTEKSSKKDKSSCAPVTASTLLYAFINAKKFYPNDTAAQPSFFPGDIQSIITNYYSPDCDNNKTFCYLRVHKGAPYIPHISQNLAAKVWAQFIPLGQCNLNNKITTTNYACYADGKKGCPTPTIVNNSQAGYGGIANSVAAKGPALILPARQKSLTGADDYCNNPTVRDGGIDENSGGGWLAFVLGLFKRVAPGDSHTQSETNTVLSQYNPGLKDNSAVIERVPVNLIPQKSIKKYNILNQAFTSQLEENKSYKVVDPLNRYEPAQYLLQKYLYPASWQNKVIR